MSILSFPAIRTQKTGMSNPIFVSDAIISNDNLLESLAHVLGLDTIAFAVISGFNYVPHLGTFSQGVVWMDGTFYKCNINTTPGQFLSPSPQTCFVKTHGDGNPYPTYKVNFCVPGSSGDSPAIEIATIDSYRMNLAWAMSLIPDSYTKTESDALYATIVQLTNYYTVDEINFQTGGLRQKYIALHAWDMTRTGGNSSLPVPHGIADFKNIVGVQSILIIKDDLSSLRNLDYNTGASEQGLFQIDATNIYLITSSGSQFNNSSYSSTSISRGSVVISIKNIA